MATNTTEASMGSGRLLNRPVKKSTTMAMTNALTAPANCVFAPTWSFRALREKLPATGKDWVSPLAMLANPSARSSLLGSTL